MVPAMAKLDDVWLDKNGIGGDERTGLVWLDDIRENAAWYRALAAIDWHDDKEPLIKLLQSGQPVPPSIAFYIGDLLDRYALKLPKARPRRPGYMRGGKQIELIAACNEVSRMVDQDDVPVAVAVQQVATKSGLSEEILLAAYTGKHGGLMRARRNWYRPRP